MSYSSAGFGARLCSPLGAALLTVLTLIDPARPAHAATTPPAAEGDAAAIATCLTEPALKGLDPRACGDHIVRACLDEAGSKPAPSVQLRCEQRRSDAWILLARQAYRQLEARLGDADRKLLRASQVQFELELRDMCMAARGALGGDPDLATATCSTDLNASRALILRRLADPGLH